VDEDSGRIETGIDLRIVQQMRQGDPNGYAQLLERYGGRVSAYLYQAFPTFDDHAVQDALADAALKVAASFDSRRGSLPAWFLFLARQEAVARLRSAAPKWSLESLAETDEPVSQQRSPLDDMVGAERWAQVEEVISSLSVLEQAVVEADLNEGGAAAADELAGRLKTTPGSVYAARRRARRKLLDRCGWIRDRLRARGEEHESGE
jgi:DNA-directed RNA polymerase specialized sigma24 family protein